MILNLLPLLLLLLLVQTITYVPSVVDGRSPPLLRHLPPHRTQHRLPPQLTLPHHVALPRVHAHQHAHDVDVKGTRGAETKCGVCPSAYDIAPCVCECMNSTLAELTCGSNLSSCLQLTSILSLANYPTNYYIRLIVDETRLDCKLEEDMWGPIMFQEILLTDNKFSTLDNHAFSPFSDTLKLLNLERNLLENVYFPTLSELSHLEVILMAHNQITFIPGFSPISLNRLKTLRLEHNLLHSLQQRTYADLPALEILDLSYNLITEVPTDAFAIPGHTADYININLSGNFISSVEEGVVSGPTTCVINLQHNKLETLDEAAFRSIIDSCHVASYIWVGGNPLICDQRLCWMIMNETMRQVFDTFHCPNLDYLPVDAIYPLCLAVPP